MNKPNISRFEVKQGWSTCCNFVAIVQSWVRPLLSMSKGFTYRNVEEIEFTLITAGYNIWHSGLIIANSFFSGKMFHKTGQNVKISFNFFMMFFTLIDFNPKA